MFRRHPIRLQRKELHMRKAVRLLLATLATLIAFALPAAPAFAHDNYHDHPYTDCPTGSHSQIAPLHGYYPEPYYGDPNHDVWSHDDYGDQVFEGHVHATDPGTIIVEVPPGYEVEVIY
jgi:hypothetical protein